MTVILGKRRIAILSVALLVLAAAGVLVAAKAHAGYPCNDHPWGVGVGRDAWVSTHAGPYSVYVGTDPNLNDAGDSYYGGVACVGAPNGEASQVVVGAAVHDPNPYNSTTGVGVGAMQCNTPLPDEPTWEPGCGWLVKTTGAEAGAPSYAINQPGGPTSGTGGSVGSGSGTCVYANSTTPTCPGSIGIAGVTVHEGDLPRVQPTNSTPPPACTGINNSCPGAYVEVGSDPTNDTVSAAVVGVPVRRDVGYTCVQVNSICPP